MKEELTKEDNKPKEYSFGSKKEGAKEIQVHWSVLVIYLVLICITGYFIYTTYIDIYGPIMSDEAPHFVCSNGTIEYIEFGKEYYCDEHYSVLSELDHFEWIEYKIKYSE